MRWWRCSVQQVRRGLHKAPVRIGEDSSSSGAASSGREALLGQLKCILLGENAAAPGQQDRRKQQEEEEEEGGISRLKRIVLGERAQRTNAIKVLNAELHAVCKRGDLENVRELGKQMVVAWGAIPDLVTIAPLSRHISVLEEECYRDAAGVPLFELPKGLTDAKLTVRSSIVLVLCKAGRFSEACKVGLAMLKQGMQVETLVLNTLLYLVSKAGLWDEAANDLVKVMATRTGILEADSSGISEAVDGMLNKGLCSDILLYDAVVEGLCEANMVPEAFVIFRGSARRNVFSMLTCKRLLLALSTQQREMEACHVLDVMAKQSAGTDVMESQVQQLCEEGEPELALKLVRAAAGHRSFLSQHHCSLGIPNVKAYNYGSMLSLPSDDKLVVERMKYESGASELSVRTCNILIAALCDSNLLEQAEALFKELAARGVVLKGSTSYSPLINALCKVGRTEDAGCLLQEMPADENNNEARNRMSNLVLQTFCKSGELEKAEAVMEWMVGRGLVPDNSSYTQLVKQSCKQGKVDQAVRLYNEMFQRGYDPDISCYNAVLAVLWSCGKASEALVLFQQMIRKSVVPDATTCNVLIEGQCMIGKVDAALKILQLSPGLGCVPGLSSYNTVLQALCRQGEADQARLLLKEMVNRGREPDVTSYNAVLEVSSDAVVIQELFRDMISRGVAPSDTTYRIAFPRLCGGDELQAGMARELIQELLVLGIRPPKLVFKAYVVGLLRSGSLDEARRFFEQVAMRSSSGCCSRLTLLACFVEVGMLEEGIKYYKAELENETADAELHIAELICEMEDNVSAACEFLQLMLVRNNHNINVEQLASDTASVLLKWRKLRLAKDFIERYSSRSSSSSTRTGLHNKVVLSVADALIRDQMGAEAVELVEQVMSSSLVSTKQLCKHAVHRLLEHGEEDAAKKLFLSAMKATKDIHLCDELLSTFCKLQKYGEAACVVEEMHSKKLLQAIVEG